MTTQVQIKRLLKPLLRHFPDLVPVRNGAVLVPISHLYRKLEVNPARGGDRFFLEWTVWPLFCKYAVFPFTMSHSVFSRDKIQWKCSSENIDYFLLKEVEEICIPSLRNVDTLDKFFHLKSPHISFEEFLSANDRLGIFTDVARGDLDRAELRCERVLSQTGKPIWTSKALSRLEYDNIVNIFYPLLKKRDLKAIGNLLRTWEFDTLRAEKLEQYWEPTPFPFEERR